jgi:hypothetical protein
MIPAKQIIKPQSASVRVNGFSASGTSGVLTTAIGTALSTAGEGGVSVPVQSLGGSNTIGVIVTGANNRTEIYGGASKLKLTDASGNEVFGRITEAGGVYTLTYFSLVAGVETAHSMPAAAIDIEFSYRFDFARFPADAAIAVSARNISNDPAGAGGATSRNERLTVTALNTVSNLGFTPLNAATLALFVNGQQFDTFGGGAAAFSLSGVAITWSAANAGFSLEVADRVTARYFS